MRVLLTGLPPLLKDILSEALAGEPDIAIVAAAPGAGLGTLVRALSPDVVLAQAPRDVAADIARDLGSSEPAVGLVAIDPDSRHAYVYGPGEAPVVLSDVSPTTIIMAVRSVA
jgi:DNA-binding NarL/FixJ family response regulator